MPDTKISALASAAALGGTELLAGVQAAASVSITANQLKTWASAGPTLVTPTLGVATATSINKVAITAPATSSTLTVADGKTLTVSNTLTFTGTDTSSVALGAGGTVLYSGGALGTPASGTLTNATGLPAAGVVGTAAILGANTFTALQTITQASANAGILASTGYSLTGSNATNMIDLAGTWNTSGNPIALKIALTNTASGATTKFVSFLAGAGGVTEVFAINKGGDISIFGGSNGGTITFLNTNQQIYGDGPNGLTLKYGGVEGFSTSGSASSVTNQLGFGSSLTSDAFIRRTAAAKLQLGAADAAAPVAQTLAFQGSRAGTDTNTAGVDATINPSIGTGTGTPSKIIINGIVGATTGTGAQTTAAALTVAGAVNGQLPSVVVGSAALATTATDGFIYIPGGAGAPTGVPTAFTGRYPLYWNTTNKKLYVYDAAWLGGTAPGVWS